MSIRGLVTGEMSLVSLFVSIAHAAAAQRSREGLSSGYEDVCGDVNRSCGAPLLFSWLFTDWATHVSVSEVSA